MENFPDLPATRRGVQQQHGDCLWHAHGGLGQHHLHRRGQQQRGQRVHHLLAAGPSASTEHHLQRHQRHLGQQRVIGGVRWHEHRWSHRWRSCLHPRPFRRVLCHRCSGSGLVLGRERGEDCQPDGSHLDQPRANPPNAACRPIRHLGWGGVRSRLCAAGQRLGGVLGRCRWFLVGLEHLEGLRKRRLRQPSFDSGIGRRRCGDCAHRWLCECMRGGRFRGSSMLGFERLVVVGYRHHRQLVLDAGQSHGDPIRTLGDVPQSWQHPRLCAAG